MIPNSVLKIGSQELLPVGDRYRFSIKETLPHQGCKFKFSIRKRIIYEMFKRGTRLEVVFPEFPDIQICNNPVAWQNKGEFKQEVKLFKNNPMPVYYFYVDFNGELTHKPIKEEFYQEALSL